MASKSQEKKSSKIQWFFLIIFIPVLFAAILGTVLLSFLGVNILDLGKNAAQDIPVVSGLFEEEKAENEKETIGITPEDMELKDKEITRLQQQVDQKEQQVRSLEEEIEELRIEMETEGEETEPESNLKDVADIYENMSAGKAAAILSEMNNEEILLHMEELDNEVRAAILGKMEPEKAAAIMDNLSP